MFYPVVWLSADLPPTLPGPAQQSGPGLTQSTRRALSQVNGPPPPALPDRMAFSTASPRAGALLRQGNQGAVVKQLQAHLQQLTYDPGPIDGQFGPCTDRAVRQFQGANGLVVDGAVGPHTWTQLQRATLSTPTAPDRPSPLPRFSAAAPQLQFHPIARIPAGPDGRTLGLLVVGLTGVGLMAYRFRPDRPKVTAQLPVYYPQPVYLHRPGAVHQPQPIYPPPATSETISLPHSVDLISDPAPHPECLPEFVYDLQQPQQRQALEIALQGKNSQTTPVLATLLNRLGSFPAVHHGTGQPYTYLLLDDLGGCFHLCSNELWVTQAALQWLRQETPYTLTIRRLDSSGGVEDREFTVALSPRQLAVTI